MLQVIREGNELIEIKVNNIVVARIEGIDLLEGGVNEGDNCVMSSSELIELAMFFLAKARERADLYE
jgi:hypothetical protein